MFDLDFTYESRTVNGEAAELRGFQVGLLAIRAPLPGEELVQDDGSVTSPLEYVIEHIPSSIIVAETRTFPGALVIADEYSMHAPERDLSSEEALDIFGLYEDWRLTVLAAEEAGTQPPSYRAFKVERALSWARRNGRL